MFPLQFIGKLITVLHSAASPSQIAGGIIFGMLLGLMPFGTALSFLVILLIVVINVNLAVTMASTAVFSMLAFFLDPAFHAFGSFLLTDVDLFYGLFTWMYNSDILILSRFNNTIILGSFVSGVLLMPMLFFPAKKGVIKYRTTVLAFFEKLKIVKMIKGSRLYGWYARYAEWRG